MKKFFVVSVVALLASIGSSSAQACSIGQAIVRCIVGEPRREVVRCEAPPEPRREVVCREVPPEPRREVRRCEAPPRVVCPQPVYCQQPVYRQLPPALPPVVVYGNRRPAPTCAPTYTPITYTAAPMYYTPMASYPGERPAPVPIPTPQSTQNQPTVIVIVVQSAPSVQTNNQQPCVYVRR